MILYTSENQGAVYTIDSEGTLYFMPKYSDGTINFEEITEVTDVDELDEEDVMLIHNKLITMMKSIGEYYTTEASKVS